MNWLLEMFATLKENGKDQVIYGEMQEDVSLVYTNHIIQTIERV